MKLHRSLLLFFTIFLILSFDYSKAATYTHASGSNQSASISATIGAPDSYYDDGGVGSNYSNSISNTTYTFTPSAGGNYVRVKIT